MVACVVYVENYILRSYKGIIVSHDKDPYKPTSTMGVDKSLERCQFERKTGPLIQKKV